MRNPECITALDHVVGNNIRRRRRELGFSQDTLAKALSISSQQVHKFEKGVNRVSAVRLYTLSQLLGMPMELFFRNQAE